MNKVIVSLMTALLVSPQLAMAKFEKAQFQCETSHYSEEGRFDAILTGTITRGASAYELNLNAAGSEVSCMRGSYQYDCEPVPETEFNITAKTLQFASCNIAGPEAFKNSELFQIDCYSLPKSLENRSSETANFKLNSTVNGPYTPHYELNLTHPHLKNESHPFFHFEAPSPEQYHEISTSCKITELIQE
ncbi:hypothetical protein [Bdellovibrio svalbardensis]|uniref:Uncharacterized protein n=1 Tax=Bdellovibrio svalbardensis TaxID=2972972 RepID=A0ABT6DN06_9BACT|nr:hypothetical protein [Bdellovibrio svalbardensis]MDG0818264.1 hypothetical protein [Bdellovibrio svalbardensis]